MSEPSRHLPAGPQSPPPGTAAAGHSSHGWSRPGRAPELRRNAELLLERADSTAFPDRVRRLAREMRLRAAELELGPYAGDAFQASLLDVTELTELVRPLG